MFEQNTKLKSSKTIDLISLALRVFKTSPFRTFMTVLGIGVSFATIFFLLSLGYGLQNVLLSKISSDITLRMVDVTTSNSSILPLTEDVAKKIRALLGVELVEPIVVTSSQIETDNLLTGTTVESAPSDVLKTLSLKVLSGNMPNENGEGAAITNSLNGLLSPDGTNVIGQEVSVVSYVSMAKDGVDQIVSIVHPVKYKIEAIVEGDQNVVFVPYQKIIPLNLPYGLIKVLAKDTQSLVTIRSGIIALGFTTSAIADTVAQANQIFRIFQIILALFGLASLVVAIVGMVNTMTISLLERVHEIGIMKVFGITKGDMEKLFFH